MKNLLLLLFVLILSSSTLLSDVKIRGIITDNKTNEPLVGANIRLFNTKYGAITNKSGMFEISDVTNGDYKLIATFIGYDEYRQEIKITNEPLIINISLKEGSVKSEAISVIASRADFRETPVAFSDITKEELNLEGSSRDLVRTADLTPSIQTTEQGGGSGESRINVRGFNQSNVSVMINGVPVNDMENGWVYWSNWDGIRDVTSSVQIQRGLGASKIANPSVGGTMNIITDAADNKPGITYKQEYGSGLYLKETIVANTGNLGNGLAISLMGIRKTSDGVVDKTYTDAYAYFAAISWDINRNHQIDFQIIGAPQKHGQRSFRKDIPYWDKDYAIEVGVNPNVANKGYNYGILHNEHQGKIDNKTNEYYNGKSYELNSGFINLAENYYHKPQMNLNWFWKITNKFSFTNVFYYSFGNGGGAKQVGSLTWAKDSAGKSLGYADLNATYNQNSSNIDPIYSREEFGTENQNKASTIIANSVNNHKWFGWLGTFDYKPNENVRLQFGGDVRSYTGEHWREVRNLLGGDYYVYIDYNTGADTLTENKKPILRQGDIFSYHYDGNVNSLGAFAQGEYKLKDLTTYVNFSASETQYQRVDYINKPSKDFSGPWKTDWMNFFGYTIKTGANYNLSNSINIYANIGYYSRPPMFKNVFTNNNLPFDKVLNEKIFSYEAGAGYWHSKIRANLNLYATRWIDKSWSFNTIDTTTNTEIYTNLPGLEAFHKGFEVELDYNPFKSLRLKGFASIGDWRWLNNPTGYVSNDQGIIDSIKVYTDNIKVGDAAQTTFGLTITYKPIKGSYISLSFKQFMDYYAYFSPESRLNPDDKLQPWKLPDYSLVNLYSGIWLPLNLPIEIKIYANAFNLLNTKYIADAEDEARYARSDNKDPNQKLYHDAQNAEVWFGNPFTFTLGIELKY